MYYPELRPVIGLYLTERLRIGQSVTDELMLDEIRQSLNGEFALIGQKVSNELKDGEKKHMLPVLRHVNSPLPHKVLPAGLATGRELVLSYAFLILHRAHRERLTAVGREHIWRTSFNDAEEPRIGVVQ